MTLLALINIADADAAGTLSPAQLRRVRLEALVDTGKLREVRLNPASPDTPLLDLLTA